MARVFIVDGREFPDPDPNLKVDDVRQHMSSFYPELFEAEMKETKRGEDIPPTFIDSHTVDEIRAHLHALAEITQPATPPTKEESREIATGAHRFLYDEGEMAEQRQHILKELGHAAEVLQAQSSMPIPSTGISTSAVVDAYLTYKDDGGAAEGYLKVRARKLRFFARQHPQLPTSPEPLRAYLRQFKTADVPTRQDQWKALADFYKYLSRKYSIPNPMIEVDKPHFKKKPGKRLSLDEAREYLTGIKTDREWAIITCYFGLRFRGLEAALQRWDDIKSDYLVVSAGKERDDELPLHPVFRDILLRVKSGNGLLFGLSSSTLAYHVERVGKRVGIRVSPRRLRNTAAALWYSFRGDKASNRLLLRHGTQDMTDHYSNIFLDELRAKEERHNPMLNLMRELHLVPGSTYPNTSSAQQP